MPQNLSSIRSKNANGLLSYSVKGILPVAVPARLVNFRSNQASARNYFARFICLSPDLVPRTLSLGTRLPLAPTICPWVSEDGSYSFYYLR